MRATLAIQVLGRVPANLGSDATASAGDRRREGLGVGRGCILATEPDERSGDG